MRELVGDEERALGRRQRERRLPEDHARRRADSRAPPRSAAAFVPRVRRTSTSGRGRPSRAASSSTCRTIVRAPHRLEPGAEQRLRDDHDDRRPRRTPARPRATSAARTVSRATGRAAHANPSSAGAHRERARAGRRATCRSRAPRSRSAAATRASRARTAGARRAARPAAIAPTSAARSSAGPRSGSRTRVSANERHELGREPTEREQPQHRVMALRTREIERGERRERRLDLEPARHARCARAAARRRPTPPLGFRPRCASPSSPTFTQICTPSRRCSARSTASSPTRCGASATSSATARGRTSAAGWCSERADLCLVGNHDLVALGTLGIEDFNPEAAEAARWTANALDEESRSFLGVAPAERRAGARPALPRERPRPGLGVRAHGRGGDAPRCS